jgi:hypothetical protein
VVGEGAGVGGRVATGVGAEVGWRKAVGVGTGVGCRVADGDGERVGWRAAIGVGMGVCCRVTDGDGERVGRRTAVGVGTGVGVSAAVPEGSAARGVFAVERVGAAQRDVDRLRPSVGIFG